MSTIRAIKSIRSLDRLALRGYGFVEFALRVGGEAAWNNRLPVMPAGLCVNLRRVSAPGPASTGKNRLSGMFNIFAITQRIAAE